MKTNIKIINFGMVSCYLLSSDKSSILVDTCNRNNCDDIYNEVKNSNVKLIVITHGHMDHVGSAASLSKKLNVPIAMSSLDVPILKDPTLHKLQGHTFLGKILAGLSTFSMTNMQNEIFDADVDLVDGMDLSSFGVEAKIMALPGHTEGSIAVVSGNNVIAGDSAFNIKKPTMARLYENRENAQKSFDKIKSLGNITVYPGHGKPFSMPL